VQAGHGGAQRQEISYWPKQLAPGSLAGKPGGHLLAVGCLLAFVGLGTVDLLAPPNITVSAVGVFPVLVAAWFLSLRTTLVVAAFGILFQVWELAVGSIDWMSVMADTAAFLVMAAVGRFAAINWAAMHAGLEREREMLGEQERAQRRLEAVLEVAQSTLEGRPVDALVLLVISRARILVGAEAAALAVRQKGRHAVTLRFVDGESTGGLLGLKVSPHSEADHLLRAEATIVVDDLSQRLNIPSEANAELGPAILVPLVAGRRKFGTLILANLKGSGPFSDRDRTLVELFAAQAAVALESARLRDEVMRLALLEDRERISQDLHDGVIQSLFGIGLDLEAAATAADRVHGNAVRHSVVEINRVIRDLRAYIYDLVPDGLYEHDLEGALVRLAEVFGERRKIAVTTRIDEAAARMLQPQSLQIILFATEALSNVGRHSDSATCLVALDRFEDRIVLEIRDQGGGFEPVQVAGKGFGLDNLRERALRLGGELEIESTPGRGTAARMVIPMTVSSEPKPISGTPG
jgi:signal transduction histidine kinase